MLMILVSFIPEYVNTLNEYDYLSISEYIWLSEYIGLYLNIDKYSWIYPIWIYHKGLARAYYIGKANHAHDIGVVRSLNPMTTSPCQSFSYYEVKISSQHSGNPELALGLGLFPIVQYDDPANPQAHHSMFQHQFPGSNDSEVESIGYHVAKAEVVYKSKSLLNIHEKQEQNIQSGDVVGCGWNSSVVFFTLNGKVCLYIYIFGYFYIYPDIFIYSQHTHNIFAAYSKPTHSDIHSYIHSDIHSYSFIYSHISIHNTHIHSQHIYSCRCLKCRTNPKKRRSSLCPSPENGSNVVVVIKVVKCMPLSESTNLSLKWM